MKKQCAVMLACAIHVGLEAQVAPRDSSATYQAAEVVVTATRSTISGEDAPSPVDIVGPERIQNLNGTTVADALQTYSGLFVRDHGGGATLKNVTLRGSATEHVLVLVDGNRYSNFQNGQVDFSLLRLDNVEKIEVLHGGSSALYGADALGGVINILTKPAASDPGLNAGMATGSYGFRRYSVGAQGGFAGMGLAAGYSDERGTDNFPFKLSRPGLPDTNLVRSNADYHNQESFLNGDVRPDDRSALRLSVQHVLAFHGVPGGVAVPTDFNVGRQSDRDITVNAGYRDTHLSGAEIRVNAGFHYGYEWYSSPGYDTYYKNRYFNIDPSAQIAVSTADRIIVGGEFARGTLESFDFLKTVARTQSSLYVSNEYVTGSERDFLNRLSLYQTLRYDDVSDVGRALTPKVGMNLRISAAGDLRVRASYGESYRVPTFNDLYYPFFSNPNLKPEHSQTFDMGLLAGGSLFGEHSAEVTYFSMNSQDRILSGPPNYVPFNVEKSVTNGVEASYDGRFIDNAVELGLNYTYTNARKRNSASPTDSTYDKHLIDVPSHLLKGTLTFHLQTLTVNLSGTFTGLQFTTEDNARSLPSYAVINANAVERLVLGGWAVDVKGEVSNLFDVNYQVVQYYPMPGRTFRLSVGVVY